MLENGKKYHFIPNFDMPYKIHNAELKIIRDRHYNFSRLSMSMTKSTLSLNHQLLLKKTMEIFQMQKRSFYEKQIRHTMQRLNFSKKPFHEKFARGGRDRESRRCTILQMTSKQKKIKARLKIKRERERRKQIIITGSRRFLHNFLREHVFIILSE